MPYYSLTNTILTEWNKKEYAVGIFCDKPKAFDCVDHDLLLMKLQYYGVQGLYLQWFKTLFQNYRPISIMTGFAKIFEMVIHVRLNEHLVVYKILVPQQYGFQKGLSTEDAIL
jgi:hypothetical protein